MRSLHFFKRQENTEWIDKLGLDEDGLKQALINFQKYVIAYNLDVEGMETLSFLVFQEASPHEVDRLYDEMLYAHETSKALYR